MTENEWWRPFGSVLVATDFSPGANEAVIRAASLRFTTDATLSVLHALPPIPEFASQLSLLLERDATTRIDASVRDARRRLSVRGTEGIPVNASLPRDAPAPAVLAEAAAMHAELIVIGRHGRRRAAFGSTVDRVVRRATVPVLVVSSSGERDYHLGAAAIDFSDTSRDALLALFRIAGRSLERVELVHVFDLPLENLLVDLRSPQPNVAAYRERQKAVASSAMEAFVASLPGDVRRRCAPVYAIGDPAEALVHHLAQTRPEVVAIGVHGRSAVMHLMFGRVADAVLRRATCDVVTAH
jgi:nucleotide-binding universal stress UspA family protein